MVRYSPMTYFVLAHVNKIFVWLSWDFDGLLVLLVIEVGVLEHILQL